MKPILAAYGYNRRRKTFSPSSFVSIMPLNRNGLESSFHKLCLCSHVIFCLVVACLLNIYEYKIIINIDRVLYIRLYNVEFVFPFIFFCILFEFEYKISLYSVLIQLL